MTSAAEIVLKMCDPEFVRKAKAADFISHAWDAMRHVATSNDKVGMAHFGSALVLNLSVGA